MLLAGTDVDCSAPRAIRSHPLRAACAPLHSPCTHRAYFLPCGYPVCRGTRSGPRHTYKRSGCGSGGLRFLRCNRNLLSDQVVHQRGFTNVRTSDQCYKTRFISLFHEISLILFNMYLSPYRIAPASTLRSGRCWTCATGT